MYRDGIYFSQIGVNDTYFIENSKNAINHSYKNIIIRTYIDHRFRA